MSRFWTRDDRLVINDAGDLIECEVCPCGPLPDLVICRCCENSINPDGTVLRYLAIEINNVTTLNCAPNTCDAFNGTFLVPFELSLPQECRWVLRGMGVPGAKNKLCGAAVDTAIAVSFVCGSISPGINVSIGINDQPFGVGVEEHRWRLPVDWSTFDCRSFDIDVPFQFSTTGPQPNVCQVATPFVRLFTP
jgi:hypothetical protein